MKMNRLYYIFLQLFCCIFMLCSCVEKKRPIPTENKLQSSAVDSLESVLNRLSFSGMHDSVEVIARDAFHKAIERQDSVVVVYIGLNMAQSFMFNGNMDSVRFYIDKINSYKTSRLSPSLHIMYSNILGSYNLRANLDYSKALNNYIDGLKWADVKNNSNNRIVLYANIVNIFYVQKSCKGVQYAQKAYNLAMNRPGISLYSKCASCIVMAQMLYVQGRFDDVLPFLKKAEFYADKANAMSQKSYIYSMYALVYQQKNDDAKVLQFYEKAISYIDYTDSGAASQLYLTYGEYMKKQGKMKAAYEMFRKGLVVSEMSGNLEYRKDLLGQMADLTYDMGDYFASAQYSRMCKRYSDTISNRRENEFKESIALRVESEHKQKILENELQRKKTEQKNVQLLLILIVIGISSILLSLLYYRQKKMYGRLVKRYQDYVSRLELNRNTCHTEEQNTDRKLYEKIEELMRNEKIYRMKDLSLELLADMVKSNRTYCSRAINTFSGMSFNRYLDTFRIAEATSIIADSSNDILFKQLADSVGYNSVAVFSKAFLRETGCSPSIYRKEVRGGKGKEHK